MIEAAEKINRASVLLSEAAATMSEVRARRGNPSLSFIKDVGAVRVQAAYQYRCIKRLAYDHWFL